MPDQAEIWRLEALLARRERAVDELAAHAERAERESASVRRSKTWRLAEQFAATRSLGSLLSLPLRALRVLGSERREPTVAGREDKAAPIRGLRSRDPNRPAVLVVLPWLAIGGAERVVLDVMRRLVDEFDFVVATTEGWDASGGDWSREFAELSTSIEAVGSDASDLERMARSAAVRSVLISWSRAGYEALPRLKGAGLATADIVHSVVAEGHLDSSLRFDPYLDHHFAAGKAQAEALRHKGIAESKIVPAPNGVDAREQFNPARYAAGRSELRNVFSLADDDLVLCWVGRLSAEKEPGLFIEVVSRLRFMRPDLSVRALIAGDGPERAALEGAIHRAGLRDVVEILGFGSEPAEVLAVSDLFLLTSRIEGSPLTLLEAMSMGCVPVAADVGGVWEAVSDGANGRLMVERTASAFSAAVAELGDDPNQRRAMAAAARATVLDRFELSDSAEHYGRVLRGGQEPGPA